MDTHSGLGKGQGGSGTRQEARVTMAVAEAGVMSEMVRRARTATGGILKVEATVFAVRLSVK